MGYVLVLRHLKPRPEPASTLRCHKLAPRNILPPLLTLGLCFFRHLPTQYFLYFRQLPMKAVLSDRS